MSRVERIAKWCQIANLSQRNRRATQLFEMSRLWKRPTPFRFDIIIAIRVHPRLAQWINHFRLCHRRLRNLGRRAVSARTACLQRIIL